MAIDIGLSNSSRYYLVPDSDDFNLPDGDWAWVALCYPQQSTTTKYIVSTGSLNAVNSFNLLIYDSSSPVGLVCATSNLAQTDISGAVTMDRWYWIYATRRGSKYHVGIIQVGGSSASESAGVTIAAGYNSTTGPNLGRRSDGTVGRYFNGRLGQIAFISGASMTTAQAVELAKGTSLLAMPFAPQIKALWHGRNNDVSMIDMVNGHVATRQGSSYGTNVEDIQTPYVMYPDYTKGTVVVEEGNSTLVYVKVGGVWKLANVYVKDAGVWKPATPNVKASGVWK